MKGAFTKHVIGKFAKLPPIRGSEGRQARLNFMPQTIFAKSGVLREENCRCIMSLLPFPWCVPTGFVYDCYAQGVECNPVCCAIYFFRHLLLKEDNMPDEHALILYWFCFCVLDMCLMMAQTSTRSLCSTKDI